MAARREWPRAASEAKGYPISTPWAGLWRPGV